MKNQTIIIPNGNYVECIHSKEIVLCKADGSYSEVVLKDNRTLAVSENLQWWEQRLNNKLFFRAHKSFLINLKHLRRIVHNENTVRFENGKHALVSRAKKKQLLERMEKLS